jgi:glutamate-1-semialdehyde 2,1-aminomutase
MKHKWTLNENDQKAVEQLFDFLFSKIYDIHAHIYKVSHLNLAKPNLFSSEPSEVSIRIWRKRLSQVFAGRDLLGVLFFPLPILSADLKKENAYIIAQLEQEIVSTGLIAITLNDSSEELAVYWITCKLLDLNPTTYRVMNRLVF